MRLFEMVKRPETAGLAKLAFGKDAMPRRDEKEILLPDSPDVDFFSLLGGKQFLVRLGRDVVSEPQLWFGGTDEQPFLVRLMYETFKAFQEGGQRAFYDRLKPAIATKLEKTFDTTAQRQGDIFAVRVPYSWKQMGAGRLMFLGWETVPKSVKHFTLFNTRHSLNGTHLKGAELFGDRYEIGEGVIEAPDHTRLELKGVHILVQARNLWEPEKAD